MTIYEIVCLLRSDLMRLSPNVPGDPSIIWTKLLSPRFIPVVILRIARSFT